MKKLALDLESLVVESFDTMADARRQRGTVHARETHVSRCEYTEATHCWGLCSVGYTRAVPERP